MNRWRPHRKGPRSPQTGPGWCGREIRGTAASLEGKLENGLMDDLAGRVHSVLDRMVGMRCRSEGEGVGDVI